jgi:hypothetical protein
MTGARLPPGVGEGSAEHLVDVIRPVRHVGGVGLEAGLVRLPQGAVGAGRVRQVTLGNWTRVVVRALTACVLS